MGRNVRVCWTVNSRRRSVRRAIRTYANKYRKRPLLNAHMPHWCLFNNRCPCCECVCPDTANWAHRQKCRKHIHAERLVSILILIISTFSRLIVSHFSARTVSFLCSFMHSSRAPCSMLWNWDLQARQRKAESSQYLQVFFLIYVYLCCGEWATDHWAICFIVYEFVVCIVCSVFCRLADRWSSVCLYFVLQQIEIVQSICIGITLICMHASDATESPSAIFALRCGTHTHTRARRDTQHRDERTMDQCKCGSTNMVGIDWQRTAYQPNDGLAGAGCDYIRQTTPPPPPP